ncbi:AraC family transcriptional regulator [Actinopolymorpha pittospori]|uniref:AraC-like DNA-binding protein n=1 Tax=Actinopolymorpha pittospori TaxID=648752 RepID=A0A927N3K4_9ACTN|nr:AraC family transcriptional regulator [Actinopolymorpha pittospori]MBE1608307.1 AraC-like DNA-binding protein [Actinopolymorpha pittospori]
MDPLEDVLSLLGTTSHLSTGLIAGGHWALRFPPPSGVKFNTVRRGQCYVRIEGLDEAIALREGDCFLLTHPRAFSLCSDLDLTPVDAQPIFEAAEGGMARTGEGEDVALIGGRFSFEDRARVLLLDALPPVIHVPAGTPEAASMQWALTQIESELRTRSVAANLVAEHLALVMLIHVLRLHLASEPGSVSGWLTGLSDPVVATALNAMHADPARPWSVEQLARVSAVSRSTLAARFKSAVGTGPLEYLTGWRIELASHRLRHGNDTLGAIAQAIGYSSESALSNAFKRVTGASPRTYRQQHAHSG